MYFLISDELVERSDLGIYEKMALVVLAKYSNSSQKITREMLVDKMGAGKVEFGAEYTDIAIKKLIKHGLLTVANSEELETLELMEFAKTQPEEREEREEQEQEERREWEGQSEFPQEEPHLKAASNSEKLRRMIEKKALEFSDENKFNIIDLSLQENITELENKRAVPIEEIKSIFEEVCTNQKAKILYHLAQKDIKWLKEAYRIVGQENNVDPLENLAEFLQENTKKSYYAQVHIKKAMKEERETLKEGLKERLKAIPEEENKDDSKMSEFSEDSEFFEDAQSLADIKDQVTLPDKNAGIDFYNGYDLKSIFTNLERKFDYDGITEPSSEVEDDREMILENKLQQKSHLQKSHLKDEMKEETSVAFESEKASAGKINMRATSFKQARNLYTTYGNPNLKKKDDAEDKK